MRQLTAKQKKILDQFVEDCSVTESNYIGGSDFRLLNGRYTNILEASDLPNDIWELLIKINDTEILYQEVGRYLMDAKWKPKK